MKSATALQPEFTSIAIALRPGEQAPFARFRDRLLADIQPANQLEYNLFHQLLAAQWNLMRLAAEESDLLINTDDPFGDSPEALRLQRLARLRNQYELTQYRALRELRALQSTRHHHDPAPAPPPLAHIPLPRQPRQQPRQPRSSPVQPSQPRLAVVPLRACPQSADASSATPALLSS